MDMPGSIGMFVLMHMAVHMLVLMLMGLPLGVLMAVQVNIDFALGHASTVCTHYNLPCFVVYEFCLTLWGCYLILFLYRYHNSESHCQHGTKKAFMPLSSHIPQLFLRTIPLMS
jgi:ABC-type microcin C transport system permease subunit YejB